MTRPPWLLLAVALLWLLPLPVSLSSSGRDDRQAPSAGEGQDLFSPQGPGGEDVSTILITEPGSRYALVDGERLPDLAPGPDGLIRAIVLVDGGAETTGRLAATLGPDIHVDHRYERLIDGLALRLSPAALVALHAEPGIRAIYPDAQVEAALATSVPLVGAPEVWALHDPLGRPATGLGVRIAVLDTGVDYTHPALGGCLGPGCKVAGGYDFVHDDADPRDGHGHGTHVAGIAAADGLSQGVAPGASILAYQVLDENGVGYSSDVIAALERAVADGAHVINLSLGGPGTPSDPLSLAAHTAVDAGCVVVAAAGNYGPRAGTVQSPAVASGVLAVGATDKQDIVAGFSSRGPLPGNYALKPDLVAPGVDISSTVPFTTSLGDPTGWLPASGTSMAAPHVAGGAALLRQLYPDWTPVQVRAALLNNAQPLGADLFAAGAGRLSLLPSARPVLLATPDLLSFGLPLLDGTHMLTVAVQSLSTTTLVLSPTLDLAHAADGAGVPISPTRPVTYATVTPAGLVLIPGGRGMVTVTLHIPPDATDGHYQGHLQLGPATVPLGFSLLSRVTLRVLDEEGQEIQGWGHMAVLARVPQADVIISNVPLQIPATFTVPSGTYHAQAFGRFGLYDHLLIPGLPPQVPYAVIEPVVIEPHAVQTITLSLTDTRTYWLDAATPEGQPAFVNAWAASFRYQSGDATWLTRLGQSSVRVLSTDLPADWPAGFSLRLSDTPPGVAFSLALQSAGYTPDYRDFIQHHELLWPADSSGRPGFELVGSADRPAYLAWERPELGPSTPPTFTVTLDEADRYPFRTELPDIPLQPWLGLEAAAEAWLYPSTGASSGLEPAAAGLTGTLLVAGAHLDIYAWESPGGSCLFLQPFYVPDWSQVTPWDDDPAVYLPDAAALRPVSGGGSSLVRGAGPVWPAISFRNSVATIQLFHPILAAATSPGLVCEAGEPRYRLDLDGLSYAADTLPEYGLVPAPMRRWTELPPGTYTLAITSSLGLPAQPESVVRAGMILSGLPGADQDPPHIVALTLPQRYDDPVAPLTATWTVSDVSAVTVTAALQPGGAVAVEPLGGGRFRSRLEPAGALTLTLAYTATDAAGNWLAGRSVAFAARPVTLTFALDPVRLPWSHRPVTTWIRGSLLGAGGQPLSDVPSWLQLRAGGRFVGYVRDLLGSPRSYRTGEIAFPWTFIPSDFAAGPGPLAISLELDAGLAAHQLVSQTLILSPPLYLPLISKE